MTPLLHPQVQRLFVEGFIGRPDPQPITVEGVRAANSRTTEHLVGPGYPVERWWDTNLKTTHGTIGLRWYVPIQRSERMLLIYLHGGGWVSGSIAAYDTLCRSIATRVGVPLVSVSYDKSPEARWPVALLQVAEVLIQAEELAFHAGVTFERLGIAGDSAGGSLVAGALHHVSMLQLEVPDAAVLFYPVLAASLKFESYSRFATDYHLTTARVRWYWEQYMGMPFQDIKGRCRDPYISPLQSAQLHRFPPTMLISAECDPLHDEGEAFVQRLRHYDVPTECLEVPGHIHGFMRFQKALNDPQWGPDAIIERVRRFLVQPLKMNGRG